MAGRRAIFVRAGDLGAIHKYISHGPDARPILVLDGFGELKFQPHLQILEHVGYNFRIRFERLVIPNPLMGADLTIDSASPIPLRPADEEHEFRRAPGGM